MLIATNGRGHAVKRPSKPAVGTMLGNLQRGNEFLILERQDEEREGDWYIQVWLRDNNTYRLEYRDGGPAEQYQTLTVSQEKVLRALLGWMLDKPDWREGFMWNSISQMFAASSGEEGDSSLLGAQAARGPFRGRLHPVEAMRCGVDIRGLPAKW